VPLGQEPCEGAAEAAKEEDERRGDEPDGRVACAAGGRRLLVRVQALRLRAPVAPDHEGTRCILESQRRCPR
jgi:hypothetical protein